MELRDGYLSTPDQWVALAKLLRKAKVFGLDSEYYGLASNKQSCVGRARIHVWSVAIRTDRLSPLGYHLCRSWVLPAAALENDALVGVLESEFIEKRVHNQSVDQHAFANHGITVRGARNTLGYVRWKRPDLISMPGRFKLKAIMQTMLYRNPICEFKDVIRDKRTIKVLKPKKVKTVECFCGEPKCKLRKGHKKVTFTSVVTVEKEKIEKFEWHLTDIVPGHSRWELLVRYAAEDAIAALQVDELCDEVVDPAPWPYGGNGRPQFNQPLEESIIEMEATGFPVDVPWCLEQAKSGRDMEEKELAWLAKWYAVNGTDEHTERHPGTKQGIDAIWSSHVKKAQLFDDLGFPRSPIHAKGRTKPDKISLDWKAMEWIANAHPPAKQLLKHLLKLQRIRSGLKYLEKIGATDGMIHPICGPAGDEDEASGAVTGRLGIKGELEAQQLPKEGEKDLFNVRRAIVANFVEVNACS
jgi:hypothetical protein